MKPKSLFALQEIRNFQMEWKPLLPQLPFLRLVREALYNQMPYKITHEGLLALRELVEDHLVKLFKGSNLA